MSEKIYIVIVPQKTRTGHTKKAKFNGNAVLLKTRYWKEANRLAKKHKTGFYVQHNESGPNLSVQFLTPIIERIRNKGR